MNMFEKQRNRSEGAQTAVAVIAQLYSNTKLRVVGSNPVYFLGIKHLGNFPFVRRLYAIN